MQKVSRAQFFLLVSFGLVFIGGLLPFSAMAQCGSISFAAKDTQVCVNQVITFKAQNIPAFTQYAWHLGLDSIKGQDKDTVSTGYYKVGKYKVRLFLKFKNNDTCSIIKPGYIEVGEAPPTPKIIVSKSNLCDINQKVRLTSPAVGIKKWTWNIGQILYKDSSNAVTHKFISTGFFDVSLSVEDAFGCGSTAIYDSVVHVERKPSVNLEIGDTSFCDTHTVFLIPRYNFFNQKGFSFDWKLAGSHLSGSAQKNPGKLFYSNRGVYSFGLAIKSKENCLYSYNLNDTIRIGKTVKFKQNKSYTAPCNEQTVSIDLIDPSQYKSDLVWKFKGDSVTSQSDNSSATATYRMAGNYDFIIRHNDLGCISQYNGENNISLRSLFARFKMDKKCSCDPNDTFSAENRSLGTSSTTTYQWNVYNSKDVLSYTSTDFEPEFRLPAFDRYAVKLYVKDTSGCQDSAYKYSSILLQSSELSIKSQPEVACVGSDIYFTADSICQADFISAEWKFYDENKNLITTSSLEHPVLNFPKEGKYSVELSYITKNCHDTVFKNNVFEVVNLQSINFTLSDSTPCESSVIRTTLKISPKEIVPVVNWTFTGVDDPSVNYKAVSILGKENEFLLKPNKAGKYDMKIVVDGGKGCKDSILVDSILRVSGLKVNFTADELVGCLPFKTKLNAFTSINEHFDHPNDASLKYSWQATPIDLVNFDAPTDSVTGIKIDKLGAINVYLNVTNSDGCIKTVVKEDIFEFDFKAIYEVDTLTCQHVKFQPTNITPGKGHTYEWYSSAADVTFHTSSNLSEPIISFPSAGKFTLSMVVKAKSGCIDTFSKTIEVAPFDFSFSVLDDEPKCTPANYIFSIKSENVDTFKWSFGDEKSIVTDQKSIAHVYDLSAIKPFRNEFDLQLIGQNAFGCSDTIFEKDLIRVLGPNPTFSIDIKQGCDPLRVTFTDSTEQVERFYFNYGDGSSVDSISFSEHLYEKKDTNKLFEVFKPYVIASDKNNCFVYYQPTDSIIVFSKPEARFSASTTQGCAPIALTFNNKSKYTVSNEWDYTNNGSIDDVTLTGIKTFRHPGTFSVKLVVTNQIGCTDTLVKPRLLQVLDKPKALFKQSDTILCPDRLLYFEDLSSNKNPLKRWDWTFLGEVSSDSASTRDVSISFKDTGFYDIKLIIEDINGCGDTILKPRKLQIVKRLPIPDPILYAISVEKNNSIDLQWNELSATGFREIQIIKDGDIDNPVKRIHKYRTSTDVLSDNDVTTRSVGYEIFLIDACADQLRISDQHKSIYLDISRGDRPYAILNWTNYVGWDAIEEYVIYRAKEGESYNEIKRLEYPDTNFIDYTVCDEIYSYLIGTVNPVTGKITYSNSVIFDPYYSAPKDTVSLEKVTVTDGEIHLKWTNNKNLNVQNFFVDRYDSYHGWKSGYYQTMDTFFIDKYVETNRISYKYRVWYRDYCNNPNPASNEASSLLLQGSVSEQDFIYSWNEYFEWPEGVSEYIVEKTSDLEKGFEETVILGSDALQMIDNKRAAVSDSAFYVRVKAVRKGEKPDTSYSNYIQIFPLALIHIPNAFSPNGDQINDVFSFDGLAINKDDPKDFDIQIYNRWGQQLFKAERFGNFWDGTFKGEDCAIGAYTYTIQFRGINRTLYSYSGQVMLIR